MVASCKWINLHVIKTTITTTETAGHLLACDTYIQVMWDSPENIQRVKERVTFLTQGCGCRSGCKNRQCRCVKNKTVCGPTCTCGSVCQNRKEDEGIIMIDFNKPVKYAIALFLYR